MIVTDFITPSSGNEYILVAIQNCKFNLEEEIKGEGEEEEAKWKKQVGSIRDDTAQFGLGERLSHIKEVSWTSSSRGALKNV